MIERRWVNCQSKTNDFPLILLYIFFIVRPYNSLSNILRKRQVYIYLFCLCKTSKNYATLPSQRHTLVDINIIIRDFDYSFPKW